MKTVLSAFLIAALCPAFADADESPLWGEYVSDGRGIQVAPRPDDLFEVVVFTGGLPGAGWDGKEPQRFESDAEEAADIIEGMTRAERVSPTEGLAAPAGGVVLYGGPADVSNWDGGEVVDGLLSAGATSQATHGDATVHVEFLVPYLPERLADFPGNSGIYLQNRYEIQILDDFGREMRDNLAGSLYRQVPPRLNACYPPGRWQTLDIDFRAARFAEDGSRSEPARVTVRQNGILILDNATAEGVTAGHGLDETAEPGPLYLQDHSDPVLFRNVWLQPRDEAADRRRPIVSAFERYSTVTSPEETGGWLVSELSCAACHEAGGPMAASFRAQGPNLTELGARVQPDWLAGYLLDPHGVKPGTTMPDVLATLSEEERKTAAKELAAYLIPQPKAVKASPVRPYAMVAGAKLYDAVGCAACHHPSGGAELRTSIPLGPVAEKWSRDALATFLQDPHSSRPRGRMPSMRLSDGEAGVIADYLLLPPEADLPDSSLHVTLYTFRASSLKEFDKDMAANEPAADWAAQEITVDGLDVTENFALRYDATFTAETAGLYSFRLGVDDGGRLLIDGVEKITIDGTQAIRFEEAALELEAGRHAVQLDYYQAGGDLGLVAEWKRPGDSDWVDFAESLKLEEVKTSDEGAEAPQQPDAALVAAGGRRFAALGCANCHEVRDSFDKLTAPSLAACSVSAGCLDPANPNTPRYDLTSTQTAAIASFLTSAEQPSAEVVVRHGLSTRNCVACHQREDFGGPESSRSDLFTSTIPEMGEEGRIPPKLDHVGDKLKTAYLYGTIKDGLQLRPYVVTRMPVTKDESLSELLTAPLIELDRVESPLPDLEEPDRKSFAAGRQLVGDGGLSCIKCHSFGEYAGTGIQAVNLQQMTPRLREDWFHRYIIDPASLRPGTRMPSGFPNGKSVVPELYDGDPDAQTAAIWAYLSQGADAAVPKGLLPDPIELVPDTEPVIYRNFFAGLSPRAIGVGYPSKRHIAFDTKTAALHTLWTGAYIDAAVHWRGRSQGEQEPLGDNVIVYQTGPAVARLKAGDVAWPEDAEVKFRGYRLNREGEPSFVYEVGDLSVVDFPEPVDGGLRRTLKVEGDGFTVRALTGSVRKDGEAFVNDQNVIVRVLTGDARIMNGEVRISPAATEGTVVYELLW